MLHHRLRAAAGNQGTAPPSWLPTDLSNLRAWYDPSDLSTLWQDVAGTVPVTSPGQEVARMDDKSGYNNHATQSALSLRPIYRDTGSFRYLQFTGDDFLNLPLLTFTRNKQFFTSFYAFDGFSESGERRAYSFSTGANAGAARAVLYTSVSGDSLLRLGVRRLDSDGFKSVVGGSAAQANIVTAQINWQNNVARLRNRAGEWFTDNAIQTPGATSNTNSLAAYISGSSTSQNFVGGMFVDAIVPDPDIELAEQYLASKRNIIIP